MPETAKLSMMMANDWCPQQMGCVGMKMKTWCWMMWSVWTAKSWMWWEMD